ncbi:TPA_asm: DUF2514 family protein [Salmonella enterica subsp. houtenae serovar 45:g,z51:-]|uniref:DUF2514 family protein n=1 Tax=Salmonella enterica subsp. houtenae serovar 45:g,z51:- TaxID=1967611 RepID=A0A736RB40_SALHO|nr:DUF2514 family protein [Salmonella enterica subsp. houtenae str. CFSAN000557]HAE7767094.1 DUF2514 family protein [Salmonella enterica subsp. houtenae serovar 45:g,z51:-]
MSWLLSRWKPVLIAALCGLAVWWFSHQRYTDGYGDASAEWALKWKQRDVDDAMALAKRQAEAREEEQRRQGEVDEIRKQASQQLAGVKADADRARAASRGLHDRADKLAGQLAERERACGAGTPGRSEAETSGAVLLADLFRRADERAGELAREADEARARGLACEAAYGSIATQTRR